MESARAASQWAPCGVVTLTTDFGLADPYVGIMKGAVLNENAQASLVDLTHEVAPQDVRSAAWYLSKSWRWFPPGSVHVAVVDPGVGGAREILVAEFEGHAFLAPDNGLLGAVLPAHAKLWAVDLEAAGLRPLSHTFHGRDLFAPLAARMSRGTWPVVFSQAQQGVAPIDFPQPLRRAEGVVETEVLVVDRYGNLISGFCPEGDEADARLWDVEMAGKVISGCKTYGEVDTGELLTLLDSYGHLEIAQREGSAAQALGVGVGAPLIARRKNT